MEIDEHHQHKDVYTHSLTVLDQAIELEKADPDAESPDLVLRLAALLHDIGKPATRRHEPRGRVSFHHHEVVGAKLVRKRLTALRYSKDVIEAVSRLTFLHLRFHGYGTRRVDRLGGAPLRHRRRRPAPPAAQAGALGLHDPQQAAGGGAVGDLRLARAADQRSSPSSEDLARVRPDLDGNAIMELLGVGPGPRGRRGLAVPQGPAARARSRSPATTPRPSCRAWWPTDRPADPDRPADR